MGRERGRQGSVIVEDCASIQNSRCPSSQAGRGRQWQRGTRTCPPPHAGPPR